MLLNVKGGVNVGSDDDALAGSPGDSLFGSAGGGGGAGGSGGGGSGRAKNRSLTEASHSSVGNPYGRNFSRAPTSSLWNKAR